nr:hybrid signal transduction histidine kinase M [Tanacetum cinerariifolium]
MAVEDNPPPPPSTTDKIIPFSIPNKVPIKLYLEKHNYNSWSSFFVIHLGSIGLKSHVETDTASTNPEWCQLDDLIKMWILGSLYNPPPPPSTTDKIIPFSIPNKVPIKLYLEKHNYNSWSSFFVIHLGSIGLKSHVETDTASTNPEWCQLDDLIKMWILGSLCDSIQEQVVTTPEKMTVNEYCTKIKSTTNRLKNLDCEVSEKNLVIHAVNGLDSRFATLVEIIRHREPLPTFETVRNMLLLKESSFNDDSGASTFDLATTTFDNKVTKPSTPPTAFVSTSSSTWHQRLGHPGDEVLCYLSSRQFISSNKAKSTHVGHACQLGKHVKLPFHSSNSLVKQSFDIIYSDLWTSPMGTLELGLHLYAFTTTSLVSQQLGVDFDETFSLVVKPATIPPGFVDSRYPNHVCLLQQSLYGLKQAPRAWFQRFTGYATRAASSPVLLQQIVDSLHKEFDMTDPGALNYFLGISVVRHSTWLFLSQKKYAFQLLERAHMVNCKPSRTPVDTDFKWGPDGVLHKFHADGTLSRYKARLVANGSSQQLGVDFDETFSLVVKPATIPPGFVDSRYPNHVCLLQQSLYGLKQAPRAWFQRFTGYATRAASSPVLLQQIVDSLHKEFDMTDPGALNYFLGISVVRHSTWLFLSQKKYAFQLLERAHMVNCKPS